MTATKRHIAAIDGLRALAVLSVVLFHINPALLPGGFVGVDVFFVISGFVVAHSIHGDHHRNLGSFFLFFYRRRFVRILPALCAYVVVVAILGVIFIPVSEAAKHIEITGAASLFGVSNIVLLLRAGDYFATSSEYNTFTHTWSLGVEEQYYLIFPFIAYILMVSRQVSDRMRSAMLVALYACCVASLATAAYLTIHWREFAFYMLPTRFWELGLGLLLRIHLGARPASTWRYWPVVGAVGLASLCASFWWTPAGAFPFPGAIWPCLSTAAMLASFWMAPTAIAGRALAQRPFRFFGEISYSLYLWHWGVIVLMRWTIGVDTPVRQMVAAAIMLVLAYGSYRLIEQPFRYSPRLKALGTKSFFATFACAGLAISASCIYLRTQKPQLTQTASSDGAVWSPYIWDDNRPGACQVSAPTIPFSGGERTQFDPACSKASKPRLFVMGDSHAGAYKRMMHMVSGSAPRPVTLYIMGGCRLLDVDRRELVSGCGAFRAAFLQDLAATARPGDILFLPGLYTPRFRDAWGVEETTAVLRQSSTAALPADVTRSVGILRSIAARGVRVILEAPKPTIPTALFRCADWFNRSNTYCDRGWEVPRGEMERRRATALKQIREFRNQVPGVSIYDPLPILCEPRICGGMKNAKPLYFDTDHLSGYANELLFASFMAALQGGDRGS